MKKLTLDEIKQEELKVLLQIDKICRENDINYSLSGGTLLGAVRHKGFIPWDDDIDIFMLREDYNKLINYIKTHDLSISVIDHDDKDYFMLFSKIYDNKNTIIEMTDKNIIDNNIGLFVDVFPVDYLGESKETALKQIKSCEFYKYLLVSKQFKTFFYNKNKNFNRNIIRFIFYIISKFYSKNYLIKKISLIFNKYTPENSKYIGAYFGTYAEKEIILKEYFDKFVELDFEGHKLKSISDYDSYLTSLYSNYMQLPPEDKRVSHHFFEAYYKE